MKQPIILVDLDDIVVDLRGPWVQWINESFNLQLTGEHLTDWSIEKCVPESVGKEVYNFLNLQGIFSCLEPMPGAVEALTYLHEMGYDIVIASAPARDAYTAAQKLLWIAEWIPWMSRRDVLLGHRKELIKADVFIDDSPANLIKYREAWPGDAKGPFLITIDWPFNRSPEVDACIDLRAGGYDDSLAAWKKIISYILDRCPSLASEEVRCG